MADDVKKKRRGFAVMNKARVSEIASQGGKAAHAAGTAHEFGEGDEARKAGRRGGLATAAKKAGKSLDEYVAEQEQRERAASAR